ncbi:MAG: S-layer homology domain-containing protein [Oscillospiraceae bacterium]|jgi:spore germination protein YaaH
MTYIHFGDSAVYTQLVDRTQASLSEVAPAYFSLDENGGLLLTPAVSREFIRRMHDQGIKVVPYISNGWDRIKGIAALDNRYKLAVGLARAVSEYELDGVNIDLENLTPDERGAYVDFVRLLREELPEGKTIAVAVAANPRGYLSGWAGSYDYAGLAQYCDYLMIMAYDESYYGSEPGPVASIGFVEKSVKYALSVVSKDKIVLGLPFYGRIWREDGGSPYGYGLSGPKVEQFVRDYGVSVDFDAASESAHAVITVKPSDEKPVVNGSPLEAGTYVIWFSDERTIKARLSLVAKYDLKGAGSWSLGQEADSTWDYFKLWLNGCAFSDVQGSWAKSYILETFLNGWMNGVSHDRFSPDLQVTRAQAATILVRMLGLEVAEGSAYGFDDCCGHWAEAYINTARKHGIVSGVGSNIYEPERPVTREEMAVMFNNILGAEASSPLSFSDVIESSNSWSYGAVSALSAKGIINGYPDGSFRPKNHITRAEITAMASRIEPELQISQT